MAEFLHESRIIRSSIKSLTIHLMQTLISFHTHISFSTKVRIESPSDKVTWDSLKTR